MTTLNTAIPDRTYTYLSQMRGHASPFALRIKRVDPYAGIHKYNKEIPTGGLQDITLSVRLVLPFDVWTWRKLFAHEGRERTRGNCVSMRGEWMCLYRMLRGTNLV
jgi:hypothetical protein